MAVSSSRKGVSNGGKKADTAKTVTKTGSKSKTAPKATPAAGTELVKAKGRKTVQATVASMPEAPKPKSSRKSPGTVTRRPLAEAVAEATVPASRLEEAEMRAEAAKAQLTRVQQALDNVPVNIVLADRARIVQYLNNAAMETFRKMSAHLPIRPEAMIGRSIDMFHRNPEHQKQILADPKNLPYKGEIHLGGEIFDMMVTAIRDESGEYVGAMLSWVIVTEQRKAAQREKDLLQDSTATNSLLVSMSRVGTIDEALQSAIDTIRDAFGWSYAGYWKLDPSRNALCFGGDSGSIGEEFRRASREATYRDGEGLSGTAWRTKDLFMSNDLGQLRSCPRVAPAQRLGIKSAVCIPIMINGELAATIDFLSDRELNASDSRIETMRNLGRLVSTALDKIDKQRREVEAKKELELKVSKLMRVAQAASDGDLTAVADVTGTDDLGRLGDAIAKMMRDLKNVIGQVVESAGQFAESSRVIAESSTYLSESSQNQSSTVEEMSASISELSTSIAEINSNASSASTLAERTAEQARQGGESVTKAIEAMVLIKKSSEQVTDIIQVISEIASQTNLLALNAAIEAARAGEHGLGFAVVADEVRKLAERSSAAAKEITGLIKESTRRVADGAELSEKAGNALETIVKGVRDTAASIAKIAQATQDQSRSATEVNKAIQDVSSLTETNASSSEELSASAEQLGAQAAVLHGIVSNFRV
jgi:methyl-accepting chemotaxis protein